MDHLAVDKKVDSTVDENAGLSKDISVFVTTSHIGNK